jgi:hypothetical protein
MSHHHPCSLHHRIRVTFDSRPRDLVRLQDITYSKRCTSRLPATSKSFSRVMSKPKGTSVTSSQKTSSLSSSSIPTSSSHHVVNVYIRDQEKKASVSSPSSAQTTKFSNPKSIAEKYNLDYEPSDDENNAEENEEDSIGEATSAANYDEELFAKEFSQHHGMKNKVDDLVSKLDSKNREIERLCVLLEAVSVVPGADPGKYIQIIDGGKEEIIVSSLTLFCHFLLLTFLSRIIGTVKSSPWPRNVAILLLL